MTHLVNVPVPSAGVARGLPDSKRPYTTAFLAENVMLRDVDSDVVQLANRPGLVDAYQVEFGTDGAPIQAVYPMRWANPSEEYSALGTADIDTDWAKSEQAVSVSPDPDGGCWFLTPTGQVFFRSENGESVFQFAASIPAGHTLVHRIRVDALGGVYLASSSNQNGGLSRIIKYVTREDDEGVDVAFRFDLVAETIADFEHYGGQLFVAINSRTRVSSIAIIDGAGNDSPFVAYTVDTPYPLANVAFGTGLIFTCLPDATRGSGGLIGGDGILATWADISAADERVVAVYDSRFAGDYPDGAGVADLPDARGLLGIASYDQTDRNLKRHHLWNPNNNTGMAPPRFRVQLSDGDPGIEFDAGQGSPREFYSTVYDNGSAFWNQESQTGGVSWKIDKPAVDASLPGTTGLWPHVWNHEYAVAFRIKWGKGQGPMVAYIVGAWDSDYGPPPDPSSVLAIVLNDGGGASITNSDGAITLRGAVDDGSGNAWVTHPDTAADVDNTWEAIIVIQAKRASAGNSFLRVNGVASSGFLLRNGQIARPRELFGNRCYFELDHPTWLAGADSFSGFIRAAGSVLAPSSSGVHDAAFPTSDLELIEGILAWRRDDGALLPSGHTYDTASGPPLRSTPGVVQYEPDTVRALRSPESIMGRLSSSSDSVAWAVSGSGYGYALEARRDGWIYVAGPRTADSSLPYDVGPRATVMRRVRDRGVSAELRRPSTGSFVMVDQPAALDTLVIDPGDGPITFEFDGAGTPSPTYVPVTRGGDAQGTAIALQQKLTASQFYALSVAELGNGAFEIVVESRQDPTETAATITFTGSAFEILSHMDGGVLPTGTWEIREDIDGEPASGGWEMGSDPIQGDIYMPWPAYNNWNRVMRRSKDDGSIVWEWSAYPDTNEIRSVKPDLRVVDWGPDVDGPEFAYFGSLGLNGHARLRLVERTPSTRPPIEAATLVVKSGLPYIINAEGDTATPLPMDISFEAGTPDIQVAEYRGLILISDGKQRYEYDPRRETFEPWESRRGASLPAGSRLMASWGGRVIHVDGGDPYRWIASAIDDHTDYDLTPTIPTATQAVSAATVEGNTGSNDTITALIPAGDDLLLVGGSSSISRLTGDPQSGGEMDSINRRVGISYGSAWAYLPDGRIAFFSTEPASVYIMGPDGRGMIEVSRDRVDADLRSVDQSKYRIQLAHSRKLGGLMVVPVPIDMDMEFDGRWWLLDDRGAWWPMRWADRRIQPTCLSMGKDEEDPVFGCFDGVVRSLEPNGSFDGGYEFQWRWVTGPYWDRQYGMIQRYKKPWARIKGQDPVEWLAYIGESATELPSASGNGVFYPGDPRKAAWKGKGTAFWFELRGFGVAAALEHATFEQHTASRSK